jgi:hypothetical protein
MHVKFSRQFLTRIESQVHCPAFSLADPADTLLKIRALQCASAHSGLTSASFDEIADPAPFDEAYPTLAEVGYGIHRALPRIARNRADTSRATRHRENPASAHDPCRDVGP